MGFLDWIVGSPFFGIGTILANFQSVGKIPDLKDRLNSLVTLGVMLAAVIFSILAEMPSAPSISLLQVRMEVC